MVFGTKEQTQREKSSVKSSSLLIKEVARTPRLVAHCTSTAYREIRTAADTSAVANCLAIHNSLAGDIAISNSYN